MQLSHSCDQIHSRHQHQGLIHQKRCIPRERDMPLATQWDHEQDTENVSNHCLHSESVQNNVKGKLIHSTLDRFILLLGDSTPSPNSYTLPPLLGSKVPNKTSSASYSMIGRAKTGGFSEDLAKTPGPGRYSTTEPSVTQSKAPAYSINARNCLPGGKGSTLS